MKCPKGCSEPVLIAVACRLDDLLKRYERLDYFYQELGFGVPRNGFDPVQNFLSLKSEIEKLRLFLKLNNYNFVSYECFI